MEIEKPDLSQVNPKVAAYIQYLEAEIEQLKIKRSSKRKSISAELPEPSEQPTSICLVTMSKNGSIKRTYRHQYNRQRRSGMGVFDLVTPEHDPPEFLTTVDEKEDLLMISDFGHGYRLQLSAIPPKQVREQGQDIEKFLKFQTGEKIRLILPAKDTGYLALVSERGYTRLLRHNYLSGKMRPGTPLFDAGRFGPVAAGCWTTGSDELFIATRNGKAIRFKEKMIHANGSLGIRLERDDNVVGITSIKPKSSVLLIGSDGKGTIREMAGFAANKAPGSGGKIAIKTDHLIGAMTITKNDDIFVVSRLSKIIRFKAIEIPPKTGVVQGVNCMSLRADQITAFTVSKISG
jgi:DNA gyrase subunit A